MEHPTQSSIISYSQNADKSFTSCKLKYAFDDAVMIGRIPRILITYCAASCSAEGYSFDLFWDV
jgi:hypothetical protein